MRGAVSIGEAAALYGLAPSTVRWWEQQGVLNTPARYGVKRRYGDPDLRRIGVAYLCCVVGTMPLDQAAIVTSGTSPHSAWQGTVGAQITQLEERIGELEAARDYLCHLLSCTDDDMAECPVLEAELRARTPRGRIAVADLVSAARAARGGGQRREGAADRDGKASVERPPGDESPGGCLGCGGPLTRGSRGRPRTYCSRACRQRAYRIRRSGRA
ncbi:MerR family transcriptional regulator [Streptomyces flavofungini]|uniref:MerR family transcriptional regulator n=1 Tax=Streptomyces flavofungini TaxID=68200 RepID=A0ABS0X9Z8_9ACTN|nr:MerR family transcriptional regulator [Streptomyces flavofungini]MBJ3810025.1 MerR family transcriptional regulator [Streptomyces flavofungini]GHC53348.1 putative transcriptional regulator, MerR family protein [Streptomyces flavofungini]